jgi:hypothetical protein
MRSARPLLLCAVLASGCNAYDWFRLTGLQQEGFSNKADIVFVIDNSASMTDEADALATNFESFIQDFATDPPTTRPDLADEVDRFLEYVHDRTANLNYQIGITTTDLYTDRGRLHGKDPVLTPIDTDVPDKFASNLLCDAACVVGDPSVDVECPAGQSPGTDNCADSEQGSAEEGIEAVYMAMCRAVEDPPEACFQPWYWWPAIPEVRGGRWDTVPPDPSEYPDGLSDEQLQPVRYFDDEDVMANGDWLRDGSVVIPVVVTDEGDQSRRIHGRSGDTYPYPELFRAFGHRMTWAVIGPNLDCNLAGAAEWGVERYQAMVDDSNGIYLPIDVAGGSDSCVVAPFDEALTQIGRLLRGLADTFPLATVPVPESIVVNVNGDRIREASSVFDDATQTTRYGDGWHYDAARNAVVLTGGVVPDYNADVQIWYLPAQGVPRELPF